SKGVYRGFPDCRMKTNSAKGFCPVCVRAISRMIEFYTEKL
ncbi:MAG: M64 family metallopeptidase, partial [Bacteroidales bacterium]|nr:M64 family metallopeptidase [Bacteroidales bacterium]